MVRLNELEPFELYTFGVDPPRPRVDQMLSGLVYLTLAPESAEASKPFEFHAYGEPLAVDFNCPCGCDMPIYLGLQPPMKHWQAEVDMDARLLTIQPSILFRPCGAHFYITENRIDWCADSGKRNA